VRQAVHDIRGGVLPLSRTLYKWSVVVALMLTFELTHRPYAMAKQDAPLFAAEIATLLQRCQRCNRPGQIGPMALRNYAEIKSWVAQNRAPVSTRRMPPWFVHRAYGDFPDNPSFTDAEIERIVAWVDAGAPRGEPALEPAPLEFSDSWSIGEPALVLTMPVPMSIEPTKQDRFECVKIEASLTEDRWINAVEIRPGDRSHGAPCHCVRALAWATRSFLESKTKQVRLFTV
jgi:hypothetical protein